MPVRIEYGNLMLAILSAVSAMATDGEISDAARSAFGQYQGR